MQPIQTKGEKIPFVGLTRPAHNHTQETDQKKLKQNSSCVGTKTKLSLIGPGSWLWASDFCGWVGVLHSALL
uniref:Uncharacterized protein n=1 Tax=Anguilla anguilla TaxID=7936 RepID=A0A0E9PCE1_ANGAN